MRAWKRFDGTRTQLLASHSEDRGETWSQAEPVATTSDASDHPQLIAHDGRAYASWHTRAEGYRLIPLGLGGRP